MPYMDGRTVDCSSCALGSACVHRCVFQRDSFPGGHVFFRQGEMPQAIHFLSKGLVLLSRGDSDGREVSQRLKPAGSLLDAQVISGRSHQATATAVAAVEVCTLSLPRFAVWLGPTRAPARTLLELTLTEARAVELNAAAARRPATARVAAFLMDHTTEAGEPGLEIQHQLVAHLLNLRPETFSRSLARLRQVGAIAGRRILKVIDRQKLASAAAASDV